MVGYSVRQAWTLIVVGQLAQEPGDGLLAARCYAATMLANWRAAWVPRVERAGASASRADYRRARELLVERGLLLPERDGYAVAELRAPPAARLRFPGVDWEGVPTLPEHYEALAETRSPGRFAALLGALVRCTWRRRDPEDRHGLSRCRRAFIVELFGVSEKAVTRAWSALGPLLRRSEVTSAGVVFEVARVRESVQGGKPQNQESVPAKNEHQIRGFRNRRHAAPAADRTRKERPAPGKLGHLDPADLRDPERLEAAFRWAVERGHVPDTEHARRWVRHLGERCLRQGTTSPGGLFRTLLQVGPGDVRSIRQDEEDRAEQRERRRNAPRLPARRVEPVPPEVSADADVGLSLRSGGFRALTAELLGVQRL